MSDTDEHLATLAGFDPDWYSQTYPDAVLSGLSPQQHYLLIGRVLGRPGFPQPPQPEPVKTTVLSPHAAALNFGSGEVLAIPGADVAQDSPIIAGPDQTTLEPLSGQPADQRPHNVGYTALFAASYELGRFASPEEATKTCGPISTYVQMVARDLANTAQAPVLKSPDNPEEAFLPMDGAVSSPVAGCFLKGRACIENIWFADESRLRFVFTGQEDSSDEAPGMLRAWQADPLTPLRFVAVGSASLPAKGPAFLDVAMINPFMPVLLELSDSFSVTQGYALITFPSLLRGGLHAVERAAHSLASNPMDEYWRISQALLGELAAGPARSGFAVSRLAVRTAGATGAERLFSPAFRGWLKTVFGLGLTAVSAPQDKAETPGLEWLQASLDPEEGHSRGTGMTLQLPCHGVPSLAALVSRRMALPKGYTQAPGPYLVCSKTSLKPLWSVALPQSHRPQADQPLLLRADSVATTLDDAQADGHWLAPLHLAVVCHPDRSPNDSRNLFPVAPDAPYIPLLEAELSLTVVLQASDPALSERALSSLLPQQDIHVGQVLVRPARYAGDAEIARVIEIAEALFPGRVTCITPDTGTLGDLDAIHGAATFDHLLMLDEAVALLDSRFLAVLGAELEAEPAAGSIGAALLHEDLRGKSTTMQFGSAGLFPAAVSFLSAPRLNVVEPDVLDALPASTYPVLANSLVLCLIRKAALQDTVAARAALPGAKDVDLHFGLSCHGMGWRSLCTTLVRAGTTRPASGRDQIDPLGLACIAPARWDDLLQSVTVLRALKG